MTQPPDKRLVTEATQAVALAGKANSSHTHSTSQVTGLDLALSGKAASSHTHTASQVTDFTEAVQDAVAALLSEGTGVTLSYDDSGNTLTITSTGGGGSFDPEATRDAIGAALVGFGAISVSVNDAADTITISTTATQNQTDSYLIDRTNHMGTQAQSTVTGLVATLADKQSASSLGADVASLVGSAGVVQTAVDARVSLGGGGGGVSSAFVKDQFAVQRADKNQERRLRSARGLTMKKYISSPEYGDKWITLGDWAHAGTITAGAGKLTGGTGGTALKSIPFDWNGGDVARITVRGTKKSTGLNAMFGIGLDFGTADHTPGSGDKYIGIGINTSGNRAAFKSGVDAGLGWEITPPIGQQDEGTLGGTPNEPTTYHFSIDISPETISMSMTDMPKSNSNHGDCVIVMDRAEVEAAYGSLDYVNVVVWGQQSSGTAPEFGPIAIMKHLEKSRDSELAALETADRWVMTCPPGSSWATEKWVYELPGSYDPLVGAPLALFCHQSVTGEYDEPWDESETSKSGPIKDALLNAGYIVASAQDGSDNNFSSSVGDRFGSQASLDNYTALYEHISTHHNVSEVFIWAASMGCSSALNLTNHRKFPTVSGIALIGALVNFYDLWHRYLGDGSTDTAGLATAIKNSYGMSALTLSEFNSKTVGYRMEDYAGWAYRGVPIKIWTSGSDAVVEASGSPLANANAFKAAVEPYSPEVTVVAGITGAHGGSDSYRPSEVLAFFNAYRQTPPLEGSIIGGLVARLTELENQVPLVAETGTVNPLTLPEKKPLLEYDPA